MPHECPRNGCTRQVPDNKLMCYADWAKVPHDIQKWVYAAYYRRPYSSDHLKAIKAAIEAVNQK